MLYTKPFSQISKGDVNIAGGKGASLGEMTQFGVPVPPGFVVTAQTFEYFLTVTDLEQRIRMILESVNHTVNSTVESASEKIVELILQAEMPQEVKVEIESAFKELHTEFVAVRSSATVEDGIDHAWAGQLDSYLNVNEVDVVPYVQKCWASLFTPRAIFYRFEKKLNTTHISVAVVVQQMVNSEVSGIAFSVHPVTKDRNQLIIEAGFGLGEAIVSGQITPDSYVVLKQERKILDINVNNQSKALHRNVNGGNIWKELSKDEASKQVLTETQILELAEIILHIENHYGFPCDIEWAVEDGKFYVVQSRPVTTLEKEIDPIIAKHLDSTVMMSMGTRGPDTLEARLKILGWTTNFRKEFGVGHRTMVINSKGNQYGDRESFDEIDVAFANKDIVFARQCAEKMRLLNDEISKNIDEHPDTEYIEELSYLLVYFKAIRWVIEDIYENVTKEDQQWIDDWRNDTGLFSALDKYGKFHPLHDPEEWTLVGIDGVITQLDTVIDCKVESKEVVGTEGIKGRIGFPGVVRGRARVALTDVIRDEIVEGDIIVAPMTTLDFLPAMKKAIAFVTDEGGVTCHAAIVAREMKKPCIIGTKVGTKIIKDGDMIEVDANQGIVTIIQ